MRYFRSFLYDFDLFLSYLDFFLCLFWLKLDLLVKYEASIDLFDFDFLPRDLERDFRESVDR